MDLEEIYRLAVDFRRYFHRKPEVAEQEYETQAYITDVLQRYGIAYTTVGTGIIARVGQGALCVALRGGDGCFTGEGSDRFAFCF